ncbi:MAG: hypothetical protein WCR55_01140, partial [Lentisphaerota bacterium]
MSGRGVFKHLESLLEERFISVRGSLEKFRYDNTGINKLLFQFIHDRIQQAAYFMIENAARQEIHLKIARLLT